MSSRRPSAPRKSAARPAAGSRPSSRTTTATARSGRSGQGRAGAAKGREGAGGPGTGPEQRPAFSLRALALFVVVLVAFAVIAPTLRHAITQQEQLRQLRADVAEAEERNADLQRRIELWQDPEYVQSQARDRLGYVMPGETPYVVVDPEVITGEEPVAEAEAAEREAQRAAATPWYLRTWESIRVAGESALGDEDPAGLTVPDPVEE